MAETALTVELGEGRGYPIHISVGALARAGALMRPALRRPRVIIVSDETVAALYLPALQRSLDDAGIRHEHIVLQPGESTKSFSRLEELMERLLAFSPDRATALAALGGGVIGDIAGFAASILLRGVDCIQIPTTLLAQVDSSVGGKTGINSARGKNLIGAFHQPRMVIIDPAALDTLPRRELLAGYAEVVKYGLLGDAEFFGWLERNGAEMLAGDREKQIHAIRRCCAMKAQIVGRDEREGGVRALLNLGHTFGHALEAETGFGPALLHGEAVAIGMALAARLSAALKYCTPEDAARIASHLASVGLPVRLRPEWGADRLLAHMAGDKKAADGKTTFILLRGIGHAFAARDVPEAALREVFAQTAGIA